MSRIVVLGAGMVGGAIARDLAAVHEVTAVDRNEQALAALAENGLRTERVNLADERDLAKVVEGAELAVCAVPGFMGFKTLSGLLEAGIPVVDISFMPEDAMELDALARERGVTAVVDMGVAPGMDNLILGFHDARMKVARFECLVGGLPKRRSFPFEYKAPFSPVDVIEEYTRPARLVQRGALVTRPALSDPELVEFPAVGTLEAFNTDGLRSLIRTMPHIPDMQEKTLRYPGHRDLIVALQAAGFFSEDALEVDGRTIRPLDVSARILLDAWKLEPYEPEITVMRVSVEGEEDGDQVRHVYHLYDEYDPNSRVSSMARTTGYACSAVAELLLAGDYERPGVSPPELVGRTEGCLQKVFGYLAERGIEYRSDCTRIPVDAGPGAGRR